MKVRTNLEVGSFTVPEIIGGSQKFWGVGGPEWYRRKKISHKNRILTSNAPKL